jgi:stearoyl-CoA desaturase (delta-9 desaturase)
MLASFLRFALREPSTTEESLMSATAVVSSRPRIRPASAIGFGLVHLAALGVFFVGFSWKGIILCLLSYYIRMFAITAGFHRYFSHRTFQLNRFWQFMLALLGQTSAQRGVLWWASNHRHHHKYSDQPEDLHSPLQKGFWWSHMGWIMADDYVETDYSRIQDMAKYPELMWLNRNEYLATLLYALLLTGIFGWTGLFYGYFLSTVFLWHGTFFINSVMHVFGKRVYETTDTSRNSMIFALVTMGEGWHNNHHYYPGTAMQGFRWWQLDASYYVLLLGEKLGIVKNLRRVPQRVREAALDYVAKGKVSFDEALHARVVTLSEQWAALKASAQLRADNATHELEFARVKATVALKMLEADYESMKNRAGRAAERKMQKLRADIDRNKQNLAEILERLVASTGGAQLQPA